MQATVYEGVFRGGLFYSDGKEVKIPEERRIIITLLDPPQKTLAEKLAILDETERLIDESAHENHLLTDDVFKRDKSSRPLIGLFDDEETS